MMPTVEVSSPSTDSLPPNQPEKVLDHPTTEPWYSLLRWNDLPHWQQDNHHIHGSYRRASYSYSRSLQSILHWHNESINIWSHLVPAFLSLPCAAFLYKTLQPRYVKASAADIVAMSCFFLGVAFCLGMSATFHTVSNHSPTVAKFWNQMDYAGISLLIAGSFIPSIYYGFWCDAQRQWTYWIMVRDDSVDEIPLPKRWLQDGRGLRMQTGFPAWSCCHT